MSEPNDKRPIDPKDLMAVERAATALLGTAISLIVLGFVIEKFELFLHLVAAQVAEKGNKTPLPLLSHTAYYKILGIAVVAAGIGLALYTYHYYTRWIRHLEHGRIDTDKGIFLWLGSVIAVVGLLLVAGMVFF